MKVAKITSEKANEIRGQKCGFSHFNPVQDKDDNWVISLETAQYLDENEYELIDWQPKEVEDESENI